MKTFLQLNAPDWVSVRFRGDSKCQNPDMSRILGPNLAPSMLSSDFANLASEAKFMQDCDVDWLHMDVIVQPMLICFSSTSPACYVCYCVKEFGDFLVSSPGYTTSIAVVAHCLI